MRKKKETEEEREMVDDKSSNVMKRFWAKKELKQRGEESQWRRRNEKKWKRARERKEEK